MAETITYDPSDDPQALAEAESRDSESLAQGEKMAEDQSNLLAGKYKDAEALEKAYMELQAKMGSNDDKEKEDVEYVPEGYEDKYNDDGEIVWDKVDETYGSQVGKVFKDADLDPWEISNHFHSNNGTITPEMNQSLLDAGFSQASITSYLSGRARESGYDGGYQGEALSEADVSEVKQLAGGESQYDAITAWASDNLPADDIKAFDDVINTGNKNAVKFAVKALKAQYEDNVGVEGKVVTGKAPNRGNAYRSMAEVVRDMSDPRYENDPAYRNDVMQKVERSNMKL